MSPPPTVVIADDESSLVSVFEAWLEPSYDVRTAESGEAALEVIDDAVDVVFLDRRIPDLAGDEVLSRVRARGIDCPIAMLTAVEPDMDIVEMRFDDYLVKPVDRDALQAAAETLYERVEFDDRCREYFVLASKKAALEAAKNESELGQIEEYHRLVSRMEALQDDLEERLERLTGGDLRSLRTLQLEEALA